MARSISEIQTVILDQIAAEPSLAGLTSTSQTAIFRLFTFVVSAAINFFEQVQDIFTAEVEDIAARSIPNTDLWWRDTILEFQFDSANPQVLSLIDGVPQYPVIDEGLRIVTRASIKSTGNRVVLVKAAKGTHPTLSSLDTDEFNALNSYIRTFKPAGIAFQLQSEDADKCKVSAEVFYNGQEVESVVKTNVIDAIDTYYEGLSANEIDGVIEKTELEDAIQSVQGVVDVKITEVICRESSSPLGDPQNVTLFSLSEGVNARRYETSAGYVLAEDTGGSTPSDTITMTLQQ